MITQQMQLLQYKNYENAQFTDCLQLRNALHY